VRLGAIGACLDASGPVWSRGPGLHDPTERGRNRTCAKFSSKRKSPTARDHGTAYCRLPPGVIRLPSQPRFMGGRLGPWR